LPPHSVDIFGEILLDMLPDVPGRLRDVRQFAKTLGGAPANVAVGLARLGRSVRILSKLSDDEFGAFLAQQLRLEGVDTSATSIAPGTKTPIVFVGLQENGERSFAFFCEKPADEAIEADDWNTLELAPILHLGSNLMPHAVGLDATLRLMRRAREERRLVAFDMNLRLNLWPSIGHARETIVQALRYCDLLKLSEDEASFLLGRERFEPRELQELLSPLGVRWLVLTYGPGGSRLLGPSLDLRAAGEQICAVDTTGAGDAFWAGLLYGVEASLSTRDGDPCDWPLRLSEDDWRRSLALANHLGARVCTERGATTALPHQQEVPWTRLGWA
jgi:sugar/nucleoside kinase (ribokinase family)